MTPPFGHYRVIQSLGSGGMADVYLAYDTTLNRRVAIKAPRPEFITAEGRARFAREARAAAGLEHVAIVPVYDFNERGDLPYLVMRYLTGGTLADRVARRPYSLAEALPIIERIAAALDYAHGRGVIHRDVKSANILFDDKDNPYLSDFGIAWMATAGETNRLTATGTVRGTFDYISPEQAQGIRDLDGRADLYSLAVVLFEMLTGDVPYRADSGLLVAAQHISAPIPDVRGRRPDLPPALSAVLARALAKRREDRYPDGASLVADLRRALGGRRVATPRPATGRSNLWPALVAVGALAIFLFALLRAVGNDGGSATPTADGRPTTAENVLPEEAGASTEIPVEPVSNSNTSETGPSSTAVDATSILPTPTATIPPTLAASDIRIVDRGGLPVDQVFVPAGSFLMGSNNDPDAKGNEFPQHETFVDAFWLDQTEVTNDQFSVFVEDTDYLTTAERQGSGRVRVETGWSAVADVSWRHPSTPDDEFIGNYPVVQISWDDATAYCAWAGGRLPTEAEWEYAARGRSGDRYPWGNSFDGRLVNHCDRNCPFSWADAQVDDGFGTIAPVGSLPDGASWIGAYEMIGNVWEWVNDRYAHGYYQDAPYANPTGPTTGDFRVLRGGAWYNLAETMRPAERGSDQPVDHDNGAGFRCAANTESEPEPVDIAATSTLNPSSGTLITAEPTNTIYPALPGGMISLIEPADCNRPANFRDTWSIEFKWKYGGRLGAGQYMEVRIEPNTGIASQGKVTAPITGDQWLQVVSVSNFDIDAGSYRWQVVLMDEDGSSARALSNYGCFTIWSDNG